MHRRLSALLVPIGLCSVLAAQRQFEPFSTRLPEAFARGSVIGFGTIATGDLDGDGRLDLVIGQHLRCEVLFAGPLGFRSVVLSGVFGAAAVQLADLDGDGDLDVVQGPVPGDSHVLVLHRNDGSSFSPIALPGNAVLAQQVVVADLDGDGDRDLLLQPSTATVAPILYANDGSGHFAVVDGAVPTPPTACAPADVDGDGDLDLVCVRTAGLGLLRNNGGTFVEVSPFVPSTRVLRAPLCAVDLDGDGFVDVAGVTASGELDVLFGGASLTYRQALATLDPTSADLVPVDADGDGRVDLVSRRLYGFSWAHNLGGRQFAGSVLLDAYLSAYGFGDLDGDGATDLLMAPGGDGTAVLLRSRCGLGLSDAAYSQGMPAPPGAGIKSIPLIGDVDGDGRTDVLAHSDHGLIVDLARGDGSYAMQVMPDPAFVQPSDQPMSRLADVDGDGDLDLAVLGATSLGIYTNDGTGHFALAAAYAHAVVGLDSLRVGDIDGDGRSDCVIADAVGVHVLRGANLTGGLQTVFFRSRTEYALELADIDGDGDLDIQAASGLVGRFQVLVNQGGAFTVTTVAVPVQGATTSIRSGDLDGDGDLDLAVVANNHPVLLANDGTGQFTDVTSAWGVNAALTMNSVLVPVDFDADGDLDLFGMAISQGRTVLLENLAPGQFVDVGPQRIAPVALQFGTWWDLGAADFDDDGDVDLMGRAGGSGNSAQAVWVNHARRMVSRNAPHLGGFANVDVFGAPGLAWVAASFARSPVPLSIPGLLGDVQLDPATFQVLDVVPTTTIGASSSFVSVPATAGLVGLEVWFQAAILPNVGPPGLTNAVYEVILP